MPRSGVSTWRRAGSVGREEPPASAHRAPGWSHAGRATGHARRRETEARSAAACRAATRRSVRRRTPAPSWPARGSPAGGAAAPPLPNYTTPLPGPADPAIGNRSTSRVPGTPARSFKRPNATRSWGRDPSRTRPRSCPTKPERLPTLVCGSPDGRGSPPLPHDGDARNRRSLETRHPPASTHGASKESV